MVESSPVGDACCMGIATEDMEKFLGKVLAKAVQEKPEQVEVDFIETPEELPSIEEVLSGVLEIKQNQQGSVEDQQKEEETRADEIESDIAGTAGTLVGDDLIDRIASGL